MNGVDRDGATSITRCRVILPLQLCSKWSQCLLLYTLTCSQDPMQMGRGVRGKEMAGLSDEGLPLLLESTTTLPPLLETCLSVLFCLFHFVIL